MACWLFLIDLHSQKVTLIKGPQDNWILQNRFIYELLKAKDNILLKAEDNDCRNAQAEDKQQHSLTN